ATRPAKGVEGLAAGLSLLPALVEQAETPLPRAIALTSTTARASTPNGQVVMALPSLLRAHDGRSCAPAIENQLRPRKTADHRSSCGNRGPACWYATCTHHRTSCPGGGWPNRGPNGWQSGRAFAAGVSTSPCPGDALPIAGD